MLSRDVQAECFVRSLAVVDVSPALEVALTVLEAREAMARDELLVEGSMEAFVLAECLGMVGARMNEADPQSREPDAELGEAMSGEAAPWRAIIDEYALGQAIAAEGRGQDLFDSGALLIGTRVQGEIEPGVVVEHGQGMTPSGRSGEVTLEVHLPKGVGLGVLEALPGAVLARLLRINEAVTVQDGRQGAGAGDLAVAERGEATVQLSPTPAVLQVQRDGRRFQRRVCVSRRVMRPARAVLQSCIAFAQIAMEQFVARLGADVEASAKGPTIDSRLAHQHDEFFA